MPWISAEERAKPQLGCLEGRLCLWKSLSASSSQTHSHVKSEIEEEIKHTKQNPLPFFSPNRDFFKSKSCFEAGSVEALRSPAIGNLSWLICLSKFVVMRFF